MIEDELQMDSKQDYILAQMEKKEALKEEIIIRATSPKKEEKKPSNYVLSPTWKEKHMQLNFEKMERRRAKKTLMLK